MQIRIVICLILTVLLVRFGMAQPLTELKSVDKLDTAINSSSEEGFPMLSPDGKLYFVRTLHPQNVGGDRAGQDIWFCEPSTNGWSEPSNNLGNLNNQYNNGIVGFADDGMRVYLHSTYSNKIDYQLGISYSIYKNGEWLKPKRLNLRGFYPKNDYINFYVHEEKGVMLLSYAAKKDDNEDIYVSFKKGNRWTSPQSVGQSVNSGALEFAPFLSDDGFTLYFSSTGHNCKGAADIFYSRRLDDTYLNWSEPICLPDPINSSGFDAYFFMRDSTAYFASNRDGGLSDLYVAHYRLLKQDTVKPKQDTEQMFPDSNLVVMTDGVQIEVIEAMRVFTSYDSLLAIVKPDSNGRFVFKYLKKDGGYYLDFDGVGDGDLSVYFVSEDSARAYLHFDQIGMKYPFEILNGEVRSLLPAEVVDSTHLARNFHVFRFDSLPADGITVNLLDENGLILQSKAIDKTGNFQFEKLASDGQYSLQIEGLDQSTLKAPLYVFDANGNEVLVSSAVVRGAPFVGYPLQYIDPEVERESFSFGGDEMPPAGTKIYLTDEFDNVLDSAYIDEAGNFSFPVLRPDLQYKLKLADDLDRSLGLDRFFVIDAEGESLAFSPGGESIKNLVGKELAQQTEKFSFGGDESPPEGTLVYLTDEDDNIIDSAVVDEHGEFRFGTLPPDAQYKLKLANTDDLSMGLGRFFVIDAEGEAVGFDETGKTKKAVVGEILAETTEKFSFGGEELPPEGTMVYLTDEDDNIIDSAVVDEHGEFRFATLPPDGNYKLKLANTDDLSMGLDRFFIMDGSGESLSLNAKGEASKVLEGENKEFSFGGDALPPAGTMVYLTDEDDNVIDSAVVDETGSFQFGTLPPDGNYKLKLANTDDHSMGLDRFFVIDAEGEAITFDESGKTIKGIVGEKKAETSEKFSFSGDERPEEGTMVYLTDEDDNVIDSAVVDEHGEFRFTKLTAFGNYKIKLDDTTDGSRGLDRFFIVDATGQEIKLNPMGETSVRPRGKEEAKLVTFYAFNYNNLPMGGTMVYLLDESDNVIDSALVNAKGEFKFKTLDSEKNYAIRVETADGGTLHSRSLTIRDDSGRKIVLPNKPDYLRLYSKQYAKLSPEELSLKYDLFQFDGTLPPDAGTWMFVYNEAGILKDSTVLLRNGLLHVPKLPSGETFELRFPNAKSDLRKVGLYSLAKGERRKLPELNKGFAYRPIDVIAATEPEFDFERFMILTEDSIQSNARVYLVDKAINQTVDSTTIAKDGSFEFGNMDPAKDYALEFDEQINTDNARLFVLENEERRPVAKSEHGFEVKAAIDTTDTSLIDLRMSLIDKPTIKSEYDPAKDVKKFKLTPPVDEDEQTIAVAESVLNKTVFDEPVVSAPATSNLAKGELSIEDYRVRDVVETARGWNVHFGFNAFLLNPQQIQYLQQVVIPMMRKNPKMMLTLEGHTDNIGTDDVNYRMAILRISNVLYHIEMAGIEDTRILVVPKGEKEPIAPNETEEGRAINRRVEVIKENLGQ